MRHTLAAGVFATLATLSASAADVSWNHDWATAQKTAAKSGKLIVADFFAEW